MLFNFVHKYLCLQREICNIFNINKNIINKSYVNIYDNKNIWK